MNTLESQSWTPPPRICKVTASSQNNYDLHVGQEIVGLKLPNGKVVKLESMELLTTYFGNETRPNVAGYAINVSIPVGGYDEGDTGDASVRPQRVLFRRRKQKYYGNQSMLLACCCGLPLLLAWKY